METNNALIKQSSIQYGLILGGVLSLISVLMYALNPDLFLNTWLGIGTLLIVIAIGIVSAAKAKSILNGFISFKEGFTAYFITIALGLLISTVVGILIFAVLDPELATYINEQAVVMTREFMEKWGTTEEAKVEMEKALTEMGETNNFSVVNQLKSYVMRILGFAVIGLLVALIMKEKDPNALD